MIEAGGEVQLGEGALSGRLHVPLVVPHRTFSLRSVQVLPAYSWDAETFRP